MGFLIYGALGSIAGMGVGALAGNQALFVIFPWLSFFSHRDHDLIFTYFYIFATDGLLDCS